MRKATYPFFMLFLSPFLGFVKRNSIGNNLAMIFTSLWWSCIYVNTKVWLSASLADRTNIPICRLPVKLFFPKN